MCADSSARVEMFFLFTLFIYLLFRDLRFLFGDHFGEFGLALFAGFGVDVELLSFSICGKFISVFS